MQNQYIKHAHQEVEYDQHSILELKKCAEDPCYMISNYVKVQHPKHGAVLMKLYPYQERMIRELHDNRRTCILASRQLGKTTTVAMWVLWFSMFNKDKLCIIASKNNSHAMEIIDRIRYAYEELPFWLKPGVKSYTKHSIEFDNGSKIKSEATTEKTGRGSSPACVTGDTQITARNKTTGEISTLSIDEFVAEVQSVLVDNGRDSSKLRKKNYKQIIPVSDYEILSENGEFKSFNGIMKSSRNEIIKFTFSDGSSLKCTTDHLIKVGDSFKEAKDINENEDVSDGLRVLTKEHISDFYDVYDILNVEGTHSYKSNSVISHNCIFLDELAFINRNIQIALWASLAPALSTGGKFIVTSTPNGDNDLYAQLWREANLGNNGFHPISVMYYEHPERGPDSGYYEDMLKQLGEQMVRQEVDCEFISSDPSLIDSLVLNRLRPSQPLFSSNEFNFWDKPKKNCSYFVGADVSAGIGGDYAVIEVLEFPTMVQIAEFRSNKTNIPNLYGKIKWICNYLADGGYEDVVNTDVPQFRKNDQTLSKISLVPKDDGPEVYWSFENNGLGQAIVSLIQNDENPIERAELITASNQMYGINTSNKTKMLAGVEFKRLLEKTKGGLILNSKILIEEIKNLTANNKGTFCAKPGATDDCVSAMLIVMNMLKIAADYNEELHSTVYDYDIHGDGLFGTDENDEPAPIVF